MSYASSSSDSDVSLPVRLDKKKTRPWIPAVCALCYCERTKDGPQSFFHNLESLFKWCAKCARNIERDDLEALKNKMSSLGIDVPDEYLLREAQYWQKMKANIKFQGNNWIEAFGPGIIGWRHMETLRYPSGLASDLANAAILRLIQGKRIALLPNSTIIVYKRTEKLSEFPCRLEELDYVICPLNVNGCHMIFGIAKLDQGRVLMMDSLSGAFENKEKNDVANNFIDTLFAIADKQKFVLKPREKWQNSEVKFNNHQRTNVDCIVYTILWAKLASEDPDHLFGQLPLEYNFKYEPDQINFCRRWIFYLISSASNGCVAKKVADYFLDIRQSYYEVKLSELMEKEKRLLEVKIDSSIELQNSLLKPLNVIAEERKMFKNAIASLSVGSAPILPPIYIGGVLNARLSIGNEDFKKMDMFDSDNQQFVAPPPPPLQNQLDQLIRQLEAKHLAEAELAKQLAQARLKQSVMDALLVEERANVQKAAAEREALAEQLQKMQAERNTLVEQSLQRKAQMLVLNGQMQALSSQCNVLKLAKAEKDLKVEQLQEALQSAEEARECAELNQQAAHVEFEQRLALREKAEEARHRALEVKLKEALRAKEIEHAKRKALEKEVEKLCRQLDQQHNSGQKNTMTNDKEEQQR